MRRVHTNELVPGMITAEDIYYYNSNQLILPKGLVLTEQAIDRLNDYAIVSIRIEDASVPVSDKDTGEEPESYFQQIRSSQEFIKFKKSFQDEVSEFKEHFNDVVRKNAPIDVDGLLDRSLSLINETHSSVDLLDMIHSMRDFDDATYAHSLNVGLLCHIFAKWLNMSDEDANLAMMCGLLHDIGKLMVPDAIIKKPGKLTAKEYDQVKEHATDGYLVFLHQNIDLHIKNSALMHHERCDGSGYPMQLKGNQIDPFAKMVAIVDVYDAMTSARAYRGPICPFQVISVFEEEGIQRFDPKYMLVFLEHIVNTYVANTVRLSDGRTGKIVYINKDALSRPTIQCGKAFVDLSKEKHLSIEAIL